jgi:uncharacterized protein
VHPDVGALLALQDDDIAIRRLESQLAQLGPQLDALAKERDVAQGLLEQATQSADSEERRRQEVAARVAQHRALQEKNQATLNTVTSMREATAATAQLEQAKRMIDEDERELAAIGQRLVAARKLADERSHVVADLEMTQAEKHDSLSADRQALEGQIAEARGVRDKKAATVPRGLLSTYERIRTRRPGPAVFPLRGPSCGNCDTMIPLQRRSSMTGSGATVICEGCGVMLYATE